VVTWWSPKMNSDTTKTAGSDIALIYKGILVEPGGIEPPTS
jgi:hypothetical protein